MEWSGQGAGVSSGLANSGRRAISNTRDLRRKLPNYNAYCGPSRGSMREGRFVDVFRGSSRGSLQNSNSGRRHIGNTRDLRRKLPNYYANCVPSLGSIRELRVVEVFRGS